MIADVAQGALLLASEDSAWRTGTDFLVDGWNPAGTRIGATPGG